MSAAPAIDLLRSAPVAGPDEPPWLAQMRTAAGERLRRDGLPTPRHEDWKYTNLRALRRRQFAPATVPDLDADALPSLSAGELPGAVFVNGRLHETRPVAGLELPTLAKLLGDDPDACSARLGALAVADRHPLAALNTYCFEDCLVVRLAPGQRIDTPILIEYVSAPGAEPALSCPRLLIELGRDSRLTLIERFAGLPGATNYTNAVTETFLDHGAQLDHYRLQELDTGEFATALTCVVQSRDSRFTARSVDLGGKLVRNDLHTRLRAPGAVVRLSGLYLAVDRQHVDNHTRIDHDAPHTESHEVFHGVLADRARAVFNGKVTVAPDSQKVNAHQSNRNLLLSGTAEIDTKPELEIYADDVRCSHGATVGQLDEEALFYLRSRGIGERTARALLTFAFAEDVLSEFELPELRNYIEQIVAQRLPDHERLEQVV